MRVWGRGWRPCQSRSTPSFSCALPSPHTTRPLGRLGGGRPGSVGWGGFRRGGLPALRAGVAVLAGRAGEAVWPCNRRGPKHSAGGPGGRRTGSGPGRRPWQEDMVRPQEERPCLSIGLVPAGLRAAPMGSVRLHCLRRGDVESVKMCCVSVCARPCLPSIWLERMAPFLAQRPLPVSGRLPLGLDSLEFSRVGSEWVAGDVERRLHP